MTKIMITTILLTLITTTFTQANVCYANCLPANCGALPSQCTQCDPGFLNIGGRCQSNSFQASPITVFDPFDPLSSQFNRLTCSYSNSGLATPKVFNFYMNNSNQYSNPFQIPSKHSYLHVKFNSAVLSSDQTNPAVNPFSEIQIFRLSNLGRQLIYQQSQSFQNGLLDCNNRQLFGSNIFTFNQRLSSDSNIIFITVSGRSQSPQSNLALTNAQIYYGTCNQQCNTCTGPDSSQCQTCRGGRIQVIDGVCGGCVDGFYDGGRFCIPCPVQCQRCFFDSGVIRCQSCNPNVLPGVLNAQGECSTNYTIIKSEDAIDFTQTTWKSSIPQTQLPQLPISKCGVYSLVGGIANDRPIGIGTSSITKTYNNLISHTTVLVSFTLFLIDQTPSDEYLLTYRIDDNIVQTARVVIPSALTNECGLSTRSQHISKQFIRFVHNNPTLKIQISGNKNYYGIRDFSITLNNQTQVTNCLQNNGSQCTSCFNGFEVVNNSCQTCAEGYYQDSVKSSCILCPYYCLECQEGFNSGEIDCTSCGDSFQLVGNSCVDNSGNVYSNDFINGIDSSFDTSSWQIYPPLQNKAITTCNTTKILGSSQINYKQLTLKKTYKNLPSHSKVALSLDLYEIDNYNPQTLTFNYNGKIVNYVPSKLKTNLCGNSSLDSVVRIQETVDHVGSQFFFQAVVNQQAKIGISNLVFRLVGSSLGVPTYEMDTIPIYSIDVENPTKGMQTKLTFTQPFTQNSPTPIRYRLRTPTRLLQEQPPQKIQKTQNIQNRQIKNLVDLSTDQTQNTLISQTNSPTSIFFRRNGNIIFAGNNQVSQQMPRYIQVGDDDHIGDRSSMRNLRNFFRGCAILALWIGIVSFLFGMSSVFDDFFILVQLIFVHIFIQLKYNPPSIRVPFEGFCNVQFLAWLPSEARDSIQHGILPSDLYQQTPQEYQIYYQDIVFARTIYHTILFFALMLLIWLLLKIITHTNQVRPSHLKYNSYFLHYYHNYTSNKFVFIQKVIRFVYFTICWCVVLQTIQLDNQPSGFNIWNSILTIVFYVLVAIYPIVAYLYLRSQSSTMTQGTFGRKYQELRVSGDRLWYFMWRYYKLLAIAIVIGYLYSSSPVIPVIILIVLHLIDLIILFCLNPYTYERQGPAQATKFYPYYLTIYRITFIIEYILFIIMEILFLALFGQRDSATSDSYMGIGYAICAFAIILLINGIFRIFWSFMTKTQYCYTQQRELELEVQKKIIDQNKDQNMPIIAEETKRNLTMMSRRDQLMSSRLNPKKSTVSKLRS